jgi:predicted N-acetyltransferase YhbS
MRSGHFTVMPDLLVNLLRLPPLEEPGQQALIRRAQPFELSAVRKFIEENFSASWADEVSVGFANKPVSVFIATRDQRIVGFAAYECTRRGFFGPTGVIEQERRKGIGEILLLACLWSLREMGYVYAIIGAVGPVRFYQKAVGAIVIPDSEPGIYIDLLKSNE